MAASRALLHWVDYVIFVGILLISIGIGIYHALSGGRQRTTREFLQGNRQIGLIPVAISTMVTHISTTTLLGYPAEIVAFGAQYWIGTWGVILGILLATVLFIPVIYPLQLTSVNEYLEMRYESTIIKYIGSVCAVGGSVFFTGFVLFGPSTAIEAVSGFPSWASILIGSVVSIIYTCIGGFKAVIWTDVFQSVLVLAGLIAVSAKGLVEVGGFQKMWTLSDEWGRLNFLDFDPDPTKRLNFYSAMFGNALTFMGIFGYLQVGVQRYSTLPSLTRARLSVLGVVPGNIVIGSLACLCGLIVFAYYASIGCDPKMGGQIRSYNQILAFFVADVFRVPAIPGLFLASLTAASLSSVSSAMNSAAANIWVDIFRDNFPNISEKKAARLNQLFALLFGCCAFLMAMCFNEVQGTMFQAMQTISSSLGGPYAALFFMGVFIPCVNKKGAIVGSLVGFCFAVWICLGSFTTPRNWQELAAPSNCSNGATLLDGVAYDNTTLFETHLNVTTSNPNVYQLVALNTTLAPETEIHLTGVQKLYSISFLWMREAIAAVTIAASVIASLLTGYRRSSSIPHNLVHPWLRKFMTFNEKEATTRKNGLQGTAVYMNSPYEDVAYSQGKTDVEMEPMS